MPQRGNGNYSHGKQVFDSLLRGLNLAGETKMKLWEIRTIYKVDKKVG